MKKNKIIIFIIILFIIIISILLILKNNKQKEEKISEIIPQEEISEDQERETMVTLYFENIETGELSKEVRIIDVKKLTENPYKTLVEMLLSGPKNEKLKKLIPDETKINDICIRNDIVYIDFSKEFIENCVEGVDNESKIIYSIVNTLCELNEVTYVKILIDGEENKEFKDGKMNFVNHFEKNV